MNILDARTGIVGDETLATFRKIHGRDQNWATIYKLRVTPELAKRFRKNGNSGRPAQATTVIGKPEPTQAVAPLIKSDGSLDPFRKIVNQPPRQGW